MNFLSGVPSFIFSFLFAKSSIVNVAFGTIQHVANHLWGYVISMKATCLISKDKKKINF